MTTGSGWTVEGRYAVVMAALYLKRLAVRSMVRGCLCVDAVAYRPAAVKALHRWPWPWTCQLGRLAERLDSSWGTQVDTFFPVGVCQVCERRGSWLTWGGYDPEWDDEPDPNDFAASHPVHTCGWCHIGAADSGKGLAAAMEQAKARGIAWRWR